MAKSHGLERHLSVDFLVMAVAIVAVTTGLSLGAANLAFSRYVRATYEARHRRIVQVITWAYQAAGGWQGASENLGYFGVMAGTDFEVRDAAGRVVLVNRARRPGYGGPMMGGPGSRMMGMGGGMGAGFGDVSSDWTSLGNATDTHAIVVNGKKVGSVIIAYPRNYGLWTALEGTFQRSMVLSALLAAVVAALIGWFAGLTRARRLVRPVIMLRDANREFAAGHLETRVPLVGDGELAELAASFNELAGRLETLEGMRRKLTADVAHELRTPLTTAANLVEALQDGVLPADAENLAALGTELGRLSRTVSDLRALSVAESGQLQLAKAPVDLREVVNAAVQRWGSVAGAKGVKLVLEGALNDEVQAASSRAALIVNGDAEALERVFGNLVGNAVRYTPTSGRVTIGLTRAERGAQVAVSDTGIGIPESELPLIFERFYRGEAARREVAEGTGVGLAIAREIVQAHGGRIEAASQVGAGSRFTVTLPLQT